MCTYPRDFTWSALGAATNGRFGAIAPQPYRGAHFATFPEALIETPILAGSPEGGLVFDPFMARA